MAVKAVTSTILVLWHFIVGSSLPSRFFKIIISIDVFTFVSTNLQMSTPCILRVFRFLLLTSIWFSLVSFKQWVHASCILSLYVKVLSTLGSMKYENMPKFQFNWWTHFTLILFLWMSEWINEHISMFIVSTVNKWLRTDWFICHEWMPMKWNESEWKLWY